MAGMHRQGAWIYDESLTAVATGRAGTDWDGILPYHPQYLGENGGNLPNPYSPRFFVDL